jgi:hypothetical protein
MIGLKLIQYAQNIRRINMVNKEHPQYKKLTPEAIIAINKLHVLKDNLFDIAKDSKLAARILYPTYIELEHALQDLWKFNRDRNYIRDWYYPHCTCAKVDNDDRYPYGSYYRSVDCPIHDYGDVNG